MEYLLDPPQMRRRKNALILQQTKFPLVSEQFGRPIHETLNVELGSEAFVNQYH
jgi:hypothetical protein